MARPSKSSTVAAAIRKFLVAGVAMQAGVDTAQAKLDSARGGMYTCCVRAALAAGGNKELFMSTCDALMADFRCNSRGIAAKHNLEQATNKQGTPAVNKDGDPIYKIPPSLSVAKSVLGGAFDSEINMGTNAKPAAFSAIRDASTLARQEREKANATPADKIRDNIKASLNVISEELANLPIGSLKALASLLVKTAKDTITANKLVKAA